MKTNSHHLISTSIRIHEQNLNTEFMGYHFEVKNTNCFMEKRFHGYYVNCYSVIRVDDEDVETFTTSIWYDEYGEISDII